VASQPVIDLRVLSTALDECVSLNVGQIDDAVLRDLRDHDFDQAPVRDHVGRYVGVVARSAAESLFQEGRALSTTDSSIYRSVLPVTASLAEVLNALSQSHGVLVGQDKPDGLVTVSDLNRHEFRTAAYSVLADLEGVLAQMIDVTFSDHWDWIRELPKNRQAQVIGAWEISKRRGVDIGPQAGAMLSDLLLALRKSELLRQKIELRNVDSLAKRFDALRDLRNRVMHPVQAVVDSPYEVGCVHAVIEDACSLVRLCEVALARGGHRRRLRWH